ncbi:MAG: hypothetical protein RL456_223 [Pseudomonadota bacterium]|jgi:uncharacterized membrane protein
MSAESALPPSSPAPAVPTPPVRRSRIASLAACAALIALGLAWELVLAPTGRGTLAIKVLPLVLALPGLWRMRLTTYRWLSLAVWLYAAEGGVRIGTGPAMERALAGAEIALAVALFAACAWHVRARLAAGRRLQAAAGAHPA